MISGTPARRLGALALTATALLAACTSDETTTTIPEATT